MECSICVDIITPPSKTILPCRHSFCEECIQLWMTKGSTCPYCRGTMEQLVANEELDKEIQQLPRTCPHRRCMDQLTVGELETHILHCEWSTEKLQQKRATRIQAAKERMDALPDGDVNLILCLNEFLPLGEYDLIFTCTQKVVRGHTDAEQMARLFVWYMYSLIMQGKYVTACERYENLGLYRCVRTKAAYALALIYQEKYTEAEEVLESIPENERCADVLTVWGLLFKKKDRYIRAMSTLQQALSKGKDKLHILLHATLGDVYRKQEKLKQAEEHYQYVFQNMEFGNALDEAELSCCMGKVATQQGLYRDAIQHYKAALDRLPANHSLEGVYKVNLADAERGQSYFVAARRDYETGIQLIQERLGQEHVELIDAYLGLGLLYKKYKKYKKSYIWTCKARALAEAKLGASHYKRGLVYKAMGDVHRKQRQFPDALSYFEKALPILSDHSGGAEAEVRHDLGRIYYECERYDEAEKQVMLAYALARRCKNREKKGMYCSTLGLILGMKGEYPKAEECFGDAAKWLEKSVGSQHPEMADLFINRAEVVMRQLQLDHTADAALHEKAVYYCTQAIHIIKIVYRQHPKLQTLNDYLYICNTL